MTQQISVDDSENTQDGTAIEQPGKGLGNDATGSGRNIDMVLDIPVTLSMELGRTRMSIHELLQLNSGSVVELQRMADEPMDVLVNGTLVAHGEAVVIDNKFGIRLTDVVSPRERVKHL